MIKSGDPKKRPEMPLLAILCAIVTNHTQRIKFYLDESIEKPKSVRGSKIRLNEKLTLVDFTRKESK